MSLLSKIRTRNLSEEEFFGVEKRVHPRADVNFMVKYGVGRKKTLECDITHTKNIS